MANNDMSGWDVVSLVSIPFVNAAIKSQGTSPTVMDVSNDVMSIHGTFGTWQVTTGGGPGILMFDLPITSIAGSVSKNGQQIAQFNYENLAARVQLVLKFIDRGTSRQSLVVDSKNPRTSVDALLDSKGLPLTNQLDNAFIKQALAGWLGSNLSDFSHVFASLDLDPSVSSDTQWAFCKPAVTDYTFISGEPLPHSFLGLMYNTAGKTTPGHVAQINPSFIPPGCEAAFMISPAMFLADFLAPSTASHFKIPSSSLTVDTDQMNVSLVSGTTVNLPQVTGSDGNRYQPVMNSMQINVQNSIITMYASTSTVVLDEWYGTVTSYDTSQSWMSLGLNESGQSLIYTNTQPSVNNHTIKKSKSMEIIQDFLEAIGITVLVIATVLTDGAALLVVGALAGVAAGGIQWGLASFKDNHQNDSPEITSLVSNLTLPVTWTGAGPFAASRAGLYDGGFFLAGGLREGAPDLEELRRRVKR